MDVPVRIALGLYILACSVSTVVGSEYCYNPDSGGSIYCPTYCCGSSSYRYCCSSCSLRYSGGCSWWSGSVVAGVVIGAIVLLLIPFIICCICCCACCGGCKQRVTGGRVIRTVHQTQGNTTVITTNNMQQGVTTVVAPPMYPGYPVSNTTGYAPYPVQGAPQQPTGYAPYPVEGAPQQPTGYAPYPVKGAPQQPMAYANPPPSYGEVTADTGATYDNAGFRPA